MAERSNLITTSALGQQHPDPDLLEPSWGFHPGDGRTEADELIRSAAAKASARHGHRANLDMGLHPNEDANTVETPAKGNGAEWAGQLGSAGSAFGLGTKRCLRSID